MLRRYIVKFLPPILVGFFLMSFSLFSFTRIAGDPRGVCLGDKVGFVSPQQWEQIGLDMALDKPHLVQYVVWLGKALPKGLKTCPY